MSSPKFLLKFKVRGRANRVKPDKTLERGEIVLGSRPLADVYVADRLVREEALVLRFDGTHLAIEVKGRLAGVFVDGKPVEGTGPVRSGAILQVGHTHVECLVDAATATCTLTTNEQYLPQVVDGIVMKAKPQKAFALTDSGPQEHLWGKSPVIRRATVLALALGVVVLAAFPFLRNSEAMTRGELFHAHAIGVENGPKDCAACHEPFSSDYAKKCAECHAGYDAAATHPYEKNADLTCSECHAEHVGAHAEILPSMEKTASGWPATCVQCHEDDPFPADDATFAPAIAKAKPRLRDERGESFSRPLMVDGFAHADHRVVKGGAARVPGGPPRKGEVPVACAECHEALGAGVAHPAIPSAEFASVSYEKCLECHADWRVPVHGRDEDARACQACHAPAAGPDGITAALRMVDIPDTGSKWVLKPRGHDFSKDECLKCHVLGRSSNDHRTELSTKVFRHDHHLRSVTPGKGGELALSQECGACHTAMLGSVTLAGTPIVDTTGCAACHTNSIPTPVAVKEGATRRVVDMVHSIHTAESAALSRSALRYGSRDSLAAGCLSCHEPVAGEGRMGFKERAKDCTACHGGHENLGQGKCVLCHVDRAPGANRVLNGRLEFRKSEPGIFNSAKAVTKTTAAMKSFDHASPGHKGSECAVCHAAADVDPAQRVLDVKWPAFDEDACVKCHVRERFHR